MKKILRTETQPNMRDQYEMSSSYHPSSILSCKYQDRWEDIEISRQMGRYRDIKTDGKI